MKIKCEICKRPIGKLIHIIFIPDEGIFIGPPLGRNYASCKECFLSYMAQWFIGITIKDLDDSIKFWASH